MSSTLADPLSIIVDRPNRRSRSESILRDLMSTSYPHSLLGNLTILLAQMAGYSDDELRSTAEVFREAEGELSLIDFVRCVELRRSHGSVDVVVKSLKLDLKMTQIDDDRKHHEYLAKGGIELPSATYVFPDTRKLAIELLRAFYCTQVRYRTNGPGLEHTQWGCRTKAGVSNEGKSGFSYQDTCIDFEGAIDVVEQSLRLNKFQVLLTHNTILLQDQLKRLWGMNFSSKKK